MILYTHNNINFSHVAFLPILSSCHILLCNFSAFLSLLSPTHMQKLIANMSSLLRGRFSDSLCLETRVEVITSPDAGEMVA